ncbi:MAG: ParB/RepB/Spo0J family partition protein [Actinomycetota bacterium]|nr:ParB/RepB/Spo0J family partition protein [Acidimicrobiia bacterium]MDQ3294167.1 ParB/RepB/Spo0J family partition protein [Actinomycetota bacterium]
MAQQRRSGLGRGLSSLIPAEPVGRSGPEASPAHTGPVLLDVPVGSIVPNPHQPRRDFDEEALASLTASVRELGVLQPILVRPGDDGAYELIAGERRWRAAKRAGLDSIPVLLKTLDDTASLEQAVVENLHRENLNPLEEAAAYQQLIEEFHLTHEQVATRVGRSRVAVTNALRLFQLPPAVQKLLADGQLSAGHAKALLGTPDRAYLEHLARRSVAEKLTVRDVEEAVRQRNELGSSSEPSADGGPAHAAPRSAARRGQDPGFLELESLLAQFLETRVAISAGASRGKVVIAFADLEDLERIYRRIATGSISE